MNIPEGAGEADFKGRRFCAGRVLSFPSLHEHYISWVWRGRRYLLAVSVSWSERSFGGWVRWAGGWRASV